MIRLKQENLNQFLGKKVKIILKNGFFYSAEIERLDEESLSVVDKFGERHCFDISEVAAISEVRNEQ